MKQIMIELMDYVIPEIELTKKLFNLDDILEFQLKHDVQIIRSSDYSYFCVIDKQWYGTSLTPMCALVVGIKQYKEITDLSLIKD